MRIHLCVLAAKLMGVHCNQKRVNMDKVLQRLTQVLDMKCTEVQTMKEAILEHCQNDDPGFDPRPFQGCLTLVLTFIYGEFAAGEPQYDTWTNLVFKQTPAQVHARCVERS